MIVASFISLIPTLLPIFNGDTYLAITEVLGQPRLRQRAFNHVKRHWRTAPLETVSCIAQTLLGYISVDLPGLGNRLVLHRSHLDSPFQPPIRTVT